MPRIKKIVAYGSLVIGSLALGLLLVEGIIRLLPQSLTGLTRGIIYVKDQHIGYKIEPNTVTAVAGKCFAATVSSNSRGFRGKEWTVPGGIAILGDSFMEAIHVNDHETLSALLSEKLAVPVYNAGLSSFGTVAELLAYRAYIAPMQPKAVVLSFFENDILDNHCGLSERDGYTTKPCARLASPDTISFNTNYYSLRGNTGLRTFLRKYCLLCSLVQSVINHYQAMPQTASSDASHPLTEESWRITEIALRDLKQEVEARGAKFIVMAIPDEKDFANPAQPTEGTTRARLTELAQRNQIALLDLTAPMYAYATQHSLATPYFSFACDGHWNATGHTVAADILANYLTEHSLLETPSL